MYDSRQFLNNHGTANIRELETKDKGSATQTLTTVMDELQRNTRKEIERKPTGTRPTGRGSVIICDYCKKPGHPEVDCWMRHPEKRPTGATARNPTLREPIRHAPLSTNNGPPRNPSVKCTFCGMMGHLERDCHQMISMRNQARRNIEDRNTAVRAGVVCQKCHLKGHLAKDCRRNINPNHTLNANAASYNPRETNNPQ